MPPPAPLPPPDDDPWDEFDTAPAPVVAPPMPGPPAQVAALPTPPPAETMLPAVPVSPTQAVAPAMAVAPAAVPQQAAAVVAAQPTTTNLGGQQVMMQAGMMPAQAATVMHVPVPVAKEPKEWPPLTHMIIMAGFGMLLFTAVLLLFANLADPPALSDFDFDASDLDEIAEAQEDLVEAQDKYDRRQAVYGAFSLFFATVGQTAIAAGLLLYTVKDGEDMPVPVRAVLLGGVLLLLTRMMTGGLDLAALL